MVRNHRIIANDQVKDMLHLIDDIDNRRSMRIVTQSVRLADHESVRRRVSQDISRESVRSN